MNDNKGIQEIRKTDLLDALAQLEHEQWKSWALTILDTEDISEERSKRWLGLIKTPWFKFTEDEKNKDREYAEKVLWIIKKHMGIK